MIQNPAARRGLTLLEIMLATILLAAVAVVTMSYVQQPSERVKRESCNLRIQQLELLARQYQADCAKLPSSNLSELVAPRYLGEKLPMCPYDGRAYVFDSRTRTIAPHNHP